MSVSISCATATLGELDRARGCIGLTSMGGICVSEGALVSGRTRGSRTATGSATGLGGCNRRYVIAVRCCDFATELLLDGVGDCDEVRGVGRGDFCCDADRDDTG